jgi:hypothetical protein
MLVSLLVLLMLSLIGIASVETSDTDMSIADNYKKEIRSFYTAEAGAELAYAVIRDTVTWRSGFADRPFEGGSFTVTLIDKDTDSALVDTVLVRSRGTRSDAVSTVEVKLAPLEPFGWAAFADEYMKLCGGTSTDSYDSDSGSYAATRLDTLGDVGSNGHVKLCGTSDINGEAFTSSPGDIEVDGGAQFQDTTSTAAPIIFDPVPQSDLDYARTNSMAPAGLTGIFNYNNGTKALRINPGDVVTMASGVYYFSDWDIKGALELEAGASVRIYLVGDAKINSGAKLNHLGAPADFLIFGTGDKFDISAGAEIRAAVYMPETQIKLNGSADLYGSFVGDFADDLGGSSFHYDRALRDLKISSILAKVSWQEL